MRYLVFIISFAALSSCSKKTYVFKDIDTGVQLGGNNIVIADRDLGAERPEAKGEYFTWKQARKACPEGYHLMTAREAEAIIADRRYNSSGKLVLGELKLVMGGYGKQMGKKEGYKKKEYKFFNVGNWADYHLYEEYDKQRSWYLSFDIAGDFFGLDYMTKKDLLSVRCVKDPAPSADSYRFNGQE